MGVVIKAFRTPLGCYVYDRGSHTIISVPESRYPSFLKLEAGKEDEETADILKEYRAKGILPENPLTEIRHPAARTLSYYLEHRVQKITLQLTQSCNLRCDYCTYSGKYHQRAHGGGRMSFETIKKSIDYAMSRSDGVEDLNIGFYGGEPLLAFENLKRAVEYVSEQYHDRKVNYSITTNGTLFRDEITRFLSEHDFSVLVSLDGPKELHDQSRVFANGEGSFDKIMDNLRHIKETYPDFFQKISFNTVVPPGSDYRCIEHFFSANDLIEQNHLSRTTVSEFARKDEVFYDDRYFITYQYQTFKILMAALGFYDKKKISPLFSTDFVEIQRFYDHLGESPVCASCAHPGGPCIPGARRPMIDIDGNIFPCERVSEQSDAMKLGHVDTGIDEEKADRLLNIGKLTEAECINCWNFVNCGLCASAADDGTALTREKKLSYCEGGKQRTLNILRSICLLHEYQYDFQGDFTMKKIAVFPIQKNNAALARHQELLPDAQVIPILAPAHGSMGGRDLSAIDGGSPTGILLHADFEDAIKDCELLYLDDSPFLFQDESYVKYRKMAEAQNVPAVFSRLLSERLHLDEEENERKEREFSEYANANRLSVIDVPVISVLTMGNENDQSNVEIGLRRYFLQCGYRVSQIGTQEFSTLFGFHAVPRFLFANMDGKRKRLMFNQFVRRIVKEEKPDLLIMGVPEAVMKYNNRILAGMGDVPCIMMDAVQSDIGVLCTCCMPYTEEYFKELSLFGRYRLNCEIIYFHISNSMIMNEEDYQDRLEHLPLDAEFVVSHMHDGIRPDSGFSIFNSYSEESAQKAYRRMEQELTENPEVMQGGV